MSGSPKEHADKLDRACVIVAIPAQGVTTPGPGADHLLITDLKRRPAVTKNTDLSEYGDAVKWYNIRAESVRGLAHELKLPYVPAYVVLLLPKDREAKMAAE
jgi:hypothetical protein